MSNIDELRLRIDNLNSRINEETETQKDIRSKIKEIEGMVQEETEEIQFFNKNRDTITNTLNSINKNYDNDSSSCTVDQLFNLFNSYSESAIDKLVIKEISDLKSKCQSVIQNNPYLTTRINPFSASKEYKLTTNLSESIIVQYENESLNLRVLSNKYTFADLLEESCEFFNIPIDKVRLYDDSELLFLGETLINYKNNKEINSEMKLIIKSIDNIEIKKNSSIIIDVKNDLDENKINIVNDLVNIEDDFLIKSIKLIFYLFFLFIVFINVLSNLNLFEKSITNDVIQAKLLNSQFYVNGANTTFYSLESMGDYFYFLGHLSNNYNDIMFLDKFIIIGKIKLINYSRVKNSIKINNTLSKLDYNFELLHDTDQILTNIYINLIDIAELNKYAYTECYNIFNSDSALSIAELNLLSIDNNSLSTLKIYIETDRFNYMIKSYSICTIDLEFKLKLSVNGLTSQHILYFGTYFLLLCYSLVNIVLIIKNIKTNGIRSFLSLWNLILLAKCIIIIATIVVMIILTTELINTTKGQIDLKNIIINKKNDEYIDTSNICYLNSLYNNLKCTILILMFIYFINFVGNDLLSSIMNTFKLGYRNMIRLLIGILVYACGYSLCFNYIFGTKVSQLRNFTNAFSSVIFIIIGDFSLFAVITEIYSFISFFLIFYFSLTYYFTLHNWLKAVIITFYKRRSDNKDDAEEENFENFFNEISLLTNKLIRSIKLLVMKREKKEDKID